MPKTKPPNEPPNSILIKLTLSGLFDAQNNALQLQMESLFPSFEWSH
jgi:hypothetical protein